MRIDAHHHLWRLSRGDYGWLTEDLTALYRDFEPDDIKPLLDAAGIEGTIVVQAADSVAETEFLLSLADRYDFILGVVGWVDLEADTAVPTLERLARHPQFVGVRPMIQDIPDVNWMLRETLQPALDCLVRTGLCFDALVKPQHLSNLSLFLERNPDLKVVIDHGAKPAIINNSFDSWASALARIAQNSNALCKLSGLVTEADEGASEEEIAPYALHILDCFGADRVMFGSDWPVLNLAGEYGHWHAFVEALLDDDQQDAVMGETAKRFYLSR